MPPLLALLVAASAAIAGDGWTDPTDKVPYGTAIQGTAHVASCPKQPRATEPCPYGGIWSELAFRQVFHPAVSLGFGAGRRWGQESGIHLRADGRFNLAFNGHNGVFVGLGASTAFLDGRALPGVDIELGGLGIWHPGYGYGFSVRLGTMGYAATTNLTIAFGPPNDHRGYRGTGFKPEHTWPTAAIIAGGASAIFLGVVSSSGGLLN